MIGTLAFGLTARSRSGLLVALRLAERKQAEALRRSEKLLERTGATAAVGGWELDLATMALRLTAQAYLIHDAPPSSRPTFEGFPSGSTTRRSSRLIARRVGCGGGLGKPYDEAHPLARFVAAQALGPADRPPCSSKTAGSFASTA